MKKGVLFLLVIILASAMVLVCCAQSVPAPKPTPTPVPAPAPAPVTKPIKIGQIYSLSGPQAPIGHFMVPATTFAFEEIGYEIAGRKIEVITEDDGTRPEMAIDKARKLLESDKVDMIIGPLSQENIEATAPVISKMGVPQLVPSMVNLTMSQYEWSFMYGGSNQQMVSPMGVYAYDKLGFKTLTIMASDSTSGHNFTDAFLAPFKKRGGTVVQEQYPPMGCSDFAPYLANLKDADACAAWFSGTDAIRFHTQYHELGIRKRMPLQPIYFGGFVQLFLLNRALQGPVADAMVGEHVLASYSYLLDFPAAKTFDAVWLKKFNDHPDDVVATPYSCVQTALMAIKAAGGDTTPAKLRDAILGLNFESPCGTIRFDAKTRFAFRDTFICKIDKDGKNCIEVPVKVDKNVPPTGLD